MKVGDLVRVTEDVRKTTDVLNRRLQKFQRPGRQWPDSGVIVRNHHPKRRPDTSLVFDVLWDTGEVEDMYVTELEVIAETR